MIQCYYQFIHSLLFAALFPIPAFSQVGHLPELFRKIDNEPKIIQFRNELEVNNVGGHLQGIQWLVKKDTEFAIISGSSSTDAYYAVVKLDQYNEVLSLNILMHTPFKHAGGIQLSEDLLVVAGDWDTKHLDFYRCDQPRLKKLLSRKFNCGQGADFRSGAGISLQPDGKLIIISCAPHIKDLLILNVFD